MRSQPGAWEFGQGDEKSVWVRKEFQGMGTACVQIIPKQQKSNALEELEAANMAGPGPSKGRL